jgi:photosystem II stability/assembly factor-like uncharacterized protein
LLARKSTHNGADNKGIRQNLRPVLTGTHLLSLASIATFSGCTPSIPPLAWESLNGPGSQNISTVLAEPLRHPPTILVGTTSGLLLTTTFGETVEDGKTTIRQGACIHTLTLNPDGRTLYAATDSGLYRADEDLQNWTSITPKSLPRQERVCRTIAIDPWKPNQLFAGIDGHGIFRSANGGESWTLQTDNLPAAEIEKSSVFEISIHPQRPDIVLATLSEIGLLRSTDAGDSWTPITEKFVRGGTTLTQTAHHPSDTEIILLGTSTGDIYKTTNGGGSWGLTHQGHGYVAVQSFAQDPFVDDLVYAGTGHGVLVSSDFGSQWTELKSGLPHIATTIAVFPDSAESSVLYVYGQGIGILRSRNGGTSWEKPVRDLSSSSVSHILTSNHGRILYACTGRAVYRREQRGDWTSSSEGLPGSTVNALARDGVADSVLYAGTESGAFITTDMGITWNPVGTTMRGTAMSFLAAHPSISNRILSVTLNGLLVSTDKGSSWKPTKPPGIDYVVNAITFHPRNAGIIAMAAMNKGVVLSTDGGLTWDESNYGLPSRNILAVSLHQEDQQTLYAWTSEGEGFRSTNRGLEWSMHVTPWTLAGSITIAFDPFRPSNVVALVDWVKLYHSDDGGESWLELPPAEPLHEILCLHWNSTAGLLLAGTRDHGLYQLSLVKHVEKKG